MNDPNENEPVDSEPMDSEPVANGSMENGSMENGSMESTRGNNVPIEELIGSVPLRIPSRECDQNVLATLQGNRNGTFHGSLAASTSSSEDPIASKPKPASQSNVTLEARSPSSKFMVATAAALLIGFCLGTMVKLNLNSVDGENSMNDLTNESNSPPSEFGLSENVRLKNGESKTFIVGDSLQFQNDVPVRKVETVTRKKVLLKNKNDESEREIEIPIRKVFLTPAETI